MDWDFSPIDDLPAQPAGRGQLYRAPGPRRNGATLLLIHGAFHGAWCWARYFTILESKGIAAAAVDLRGHGRLQQDSAFVRQSISDMAEDAVAAMRALGDDIILVGHSFGALVALSAAAQVAPKALVLLAPASPEGLVGHRTPPRFAPDTDRKSTRLNSSHT